MITAMIKHLPVKEIRVDVNNVDFQAAISDYISTGDSIYGADINCWDVSQVTFMTKAFQDQTTFNERLDCWDVSNVERMNFMFDNASSFNQSLNNWTVSSVTNMAHV